MISATIWRTWTFRLSAIPLAAIGLIGAAHGPRYDVIVAPSGDLAAVRDADGALQVVGKQFESTSVGRNPGYHRIDIGGTFRLLGRVGKMDRLELTARIDNVTNNQYDEVFGFKSLGINAMVGLRAFFK